MLPIETIHLRRQGCPYGTASPNATPPTLPCEWDNFLIGMIRDQAKVLPGPGMLNRPAPRKIRIGPVQIVEKGQLLRFLQSATSVIPVS
jgi:hypothetical protein